MAAKKRAKIHSPELRVVEETLNEIYLALGFSVIALQQTQKALEKDAVTLRVNAEQFRDSLKNLQAKQRLLFTQLDKAGVMEK